MPEILNPEQMKLVIRVFTGFFGALVAITTSLSLYIANGALDELENLKNSQSELRSNQSNLANQIDMMLQTRYTKADAEQAELRSVDRTRELQKEFFYSLTRQSEEVRDIWRTIADIRERIAKIEPQ